MKIIIKQAKIIDGSSAYNGKSKDILIENGVIVSIKDSIPNDDAKVIEARNLHVSIGWVDLRVPFFNWGGGGNTSLEYKGDDTEDSWVYPSVYHLAK